MADRQIFQIPLVYEVYVVAEVTANTLEEALASVARQPHQLADLCQTGCLIEDSSRIDVSGLAVKNSQYQLPAPEALRALAENYFVSL